MRGDLVANAEEGKHRVLTILTVQRTRQDDYVFKQLFSVFNTKELLEGEMTLLGIWHVGEQEGGAGMTHCFSSLEQPEGWVSCKHRCRQVNLYRMTVK